MRSFFFALSIFSVFLSGCESRGFDTLPREELFSIAIGKMEDQIDLFQLPQIPSRYKTSLFMRDGAFYIASGASHKVMEFTSYGDLLSLYYDPSENPRPVILQNPADGGMTSNRRAYPYAFRQVGEIAVSSAKILYIEDRLPDERAVYDEKLGINLNRIVLRFENGEYRGYLGQEGIGGTPFPFILGIRVSNRDEVSVLCRTMTGWIVFWYSSAGELLYTLHIPADRLPAHEGDGYFANLETVIPDPDVRVVYLKLDYYRQGVDGSTGIKFGIEEVLSRIYSLNVETSRYEGFVDIPENIRRERGGALFETREVGYLYEFVGVVSGGHFFLRSREEGNSHQLLVLHNDGRVIRRRSLTVEDSELLFSVFHLSPEGILSALLASESGAKIVWWRSDTLLGGR